MYLVMITIGIIALDQITKWLIVQNMQIGESIPIIPDFLYITSFRNTGAAWGMFEGRMWFFYILTVVFIVISIWFVKQSSLKDKLFGVAMGFILGGAIGNFIDRIFRQEVVDFVDTYIFNYDFPIFNVADMGLVIGVILMFIQIFLEGKRDRKK